MKREQDEKSREREKDARNNGVEQPKKIPANIINQSFLRLL